MATKTKSKTETKSRKGTAKKSATGRTSTRVTSRSSANKKKSLKTTTKSRTSAGKKVSKKTATPRAEEKEVSIDSKADIKTGITEAVESKSIILPSDTPFAASPGIDDLETIPSSPALEKITSGIAGIDRFEAPVDTPSGIPVAGDGEVVISRELLSRIAIMAIDEIDGIEPARCDTVTKFMNSVQGRVNGIRVEKGNTEVAVDMVVRVRYRSNIPELTQRLRETVGRRIWEMTGLRVVEANVRIQDITSIAPV